jgi:hypothetical protein
MFRQKTVWADSLCLLKSRFSLQRLMLRPTMDTLLAMAVLLSFLLTRRISARSRAALQLEILALRRQLRVLQRRRPPRVDAVDVRSRRGMCQPATYRLFGRDSQFLTFALCRRLLLLPLVVAAKGQEKRQHLLPAATHAG